MVHQLLLTRLINDHACRLRQRWLFSGSKNQLDDQVVYQELRIDVKGLL